jgi:hypothetical protein
MTPALQALAVTHPYFLLTDLPLEEWGWAGGARSTDLGSPEGAPQIRITRQPRWQDRPDPRSPLDGLVGSSQLSGLPRGLVRWAPFRSA